MSKKLKKSLALILSLVTVFSVAFTSMAEVEVVEEIDQIVIPEEPVVVVSDNLSAATVEEVVEVAEVVGDGLSEGEVAADAADEANLLGTGITTWADFQAAIKAAGNTPTTITLTQNLTAPANGEPVTIGKNQNITLDLNGYTLDRGLKGKEASANGNAIRVQAGASLTVKNGTITGANAKTGGAVNAAKAKELNFEGVDFIDNSGANGGAMYFVDNQKVSISDCEFSGNTGTGNGGAIIINRNDDVAQEIVIDGCSFKNNRTTGGSGSAINVRSGNITVTVKESTFTGNAAECPAQDDGGAICVYNAGLILDGCTVTGNTALAGNTCGGVSLAGTGSYTIKGKTTITGNTCDGKAADLCLGKNTVTFKLDGLDKASRIGILTVYNIGKGASATVAENVTEEAAKCFFAENAGYSSEYKNGKLVLSNPSEPKKEESSSEEHEPLYTGTWNNPVKSGSWSQDAHGIWHYTSSEMFRQTWAYIFNPYAHDGQNSSDWFWFDRQGNMLTGWQFINGKWYYLHTDKDGTLGACQLGGVTPDGWTVDESGAWIESIPRK